MARQGWGDPARRPGLPPAARRWLERELGPLSPSPPVPPAVGPSRLPEAARDALARVAGLAVDDDARLAHAAGRSYLDLLALRGGPVDGPDAVVLPADPAQVAQVLQVCREHRVAVVPFGGGTSVVGGVRPDRGGCRAVVALDLARLDRLLAVDAQDLTATFQAGIRGAAAEELLAARGLTLGHFPQSYELASLGGYAATRSAGQASTGYGRFDELVLGLVAQTPAGPLHLGRGAASAAGPDLRQLLLGSEGALGVITELTLQVRRRPASPRYDGVFFAEWEAGLAALRELAQRDLAPHVARLSDPEETRAQLALSGAAGWQRGYLRARRARCLAVLGWLDDDRRRRAARPVLRRYGGFGVGSGPGRAWAAGRFTGPYLRDDLLDAGVLVETVETSARWSALQQTDTALRDALRSALPGALVLCHVSHLYPWGASLYVTVLDRQGADPADRWRAAKAAATDALVRAGATITHHHAVGTDHLPWVTEEVGPVGVAALRAVKAALDPTGICNPGKLIP